VTGLLLAVDGGNSKTDVALLRADGSVVAALRGPTVSHQAVGAERGAARLRALARAACEAGGEPDAVPLDLAVLCLAGMDSPADERVLAAAHGDGGLARDVQLHNDTEAVLRAGSPDGWGVGVVLGAGINAVGVSPTGERVRFAALGTISGDVGGGSWLGEQALGAAIRAHERRGPATVLGGLVAARFGVERAIDVTMGLYDGRIQERRLRELAPDVVTAAAGGDAVATRIMETLADEVASWAGAAIRRGGMADLDVPVVLAGGVARGADPLLTGLVERRVHAVAPGARLSVLHAPPVLGAALLALDAVAPDDPTAADRARAALSSADLPLATGIA
jgi:N-acetylglucosamine kinase-like BadF-type ATPase